MYDYKILIMILVTAINAQDDLLHSRLIKKDSHVELETSHSILPHILPQSNGQQGNYLTPNEKISPLWTHVDPLGTADEFRAASPVLEENRKEVSEDFDCESFGRKGVCTPFYLCHDDDSEEHDHSYEASEEECEKENEICCISKYHP